MDVMKSKDDSPGVLETEDHERQQLEGFMMVYELVRPICRASLLKEALSERTKQKINLKADKITATLKDLEAKAQGALERTGGDAPFFYQ